MLRDYRTAPIDEKLRATLAFLERVTLSPEQVTADDARAALASGVSGPALVQALDVLFLFNQFDRLSDALGWNVLTPDQFRRWGRFLFKNGYGGTKARA